MRLRLFQPQASSPRPNTSPSPLGRRTLLRSVALALASGISVLALGPVNPSVANSGFERSGPNPTPQRLSQNKPIEITLVSYAVTKAAYDKIIPLFVAKWKRERGQDVIINTSYGGSGSQTRAVLDGLEADVVALALGLDTRKLEKSGLIQPGWENEVPNNGTVTKSVIAFVTRQGNPKGIRNWNDLLKPDVSVVTANPKTSGGARWNFLGLWGSITQTGGNEEQATNYLREVFKKAPVLP